MSFLSMLLTAMDTNIASKNNFRDILVYSWEFYLWGLVVIWLFRGVFYRLGVVQWLKCCSRRLMEDSISIHSQYLCDYMLNTGIKTLLNLTYCSFNWVKSWIVCMCVCTGYWVSRSVYSCLAPVCWRCLDASAARRPWSAGLVPPVPSAAPPAHVPYTHTHTHRF